MIATLVLLAQVLAPQATDSPFFDVLPPQSTVQPGSGSRSPFINVRAAPYFAVGDGVADDTAAIQAGVTAAAASGQQLLIPYGTYIVEGSSIKDCGYTTGVSGSGSGGIAVPSNSSIVMGAGAVLKQKANTTGKYNILRLEKVSNVQISGGTIDGNRANVVAPATEWGYGIAVCGATNVLITNVTIQNAWGDGIFIQEAADLTMSSNVQISNVTSTGNRRQGMSVIGVNGLLVNGSTFQSTSGTAPQDGVDIEPGGSGHSVNDLTFANCTFKNNTGRGFFAQATTGPDVGKINIVGGLVYGNTAEGIGAFSVSGGLLIEGVTSSTNGLDGIVLQTVTDATLNGNVSWGNSQTTDNTSMGINIQTSTRVFVVGNQVRHAGGANRHKYGISNNTNTDSWFADNDLQNSGRTTDINTATPTNTWVGPYKRNDGTPSGVGALGAISSTATLPGFSPSGTMPSAKTYSFGLHADPTGSAGAYTIGTGNNSSEAYAEFRGGAAITGGGADSVTGVRLMRGTSAGYENLLVLDNNAVFLKTIAQGTTADTYSASITPNANAGSIHTITATNGTGFAINAPSNPLTGQRITYVVRNTSGGALGVITWNAIFKMAAFTSPATGNSRSIEFYYNGTNWVQFYQSAADVPN